MKKRPQYSRWTRTAALAALDRSGGSYYQTEKETGIPRATLRRWANEAAQHADRPQSVGVEPLVDDEATLDERFQHLADHLVEAMLYRLDEANLHQMTETLKFVLDRIGQTGDDTGTDAREKLIRLLDRYAEAGQVQRGSESTDGG